MRPNVQFPLFDDPPAGHTVRPPAGNCPDITDLNLPWKRVTLRTMCMAKETVVIDGEACVPVPARG
jgi:hypothetical protein